MLSSLVSYWVSTIGVDGIRGDLIRSIEFRRQQGLIISLQNYILFLSKLSRMAWIADTSATNRIDDAGENSADAPPNSISMSSSSVSRKTLHSGIILLLLATALVSSTLLQETRVVERATSSPVFVLTPPPKRELPQIVWLASFPNSGTSYTMTLVERASNLSTATNYGLEVTAPGDTSLPLHQNHSEGPYWEGLSGKLGTIRQLPDTFVLTKTHCGSRCVHCGPDQYIEDTLNFVAACVKTSALSRSGRRLEFHYQPQRVARVVHLIRNPFHNIVARFHLERRHMVAKRPSVADRIPNNATGFIRWCRDLDDLYVDAEDKIFGHDPAFLKLMRKVPCRGEFYKYAQWHERVLDMTPLLGDGVVPVLTVHYEDYAYKFNQTLERLLNFVEQTAVGTLRPFRDLPTYEDHYSAAEQRSVKELLKVVSTPRVWALIQHYFEKV